MGEDRDSFRQLERANRRKTVELVAIFILVYCLLGLALDLIVHHIVSHRLSGFPTLTIVAAAFAAAQALRAYYRGSSVILGAVDADDLTSESATGRTVADIVDEMVLAARIPRPRLCVMEDPAPNAFATGRDPAHSVICVTRGLVDRLDREEMQGVIAHEIAHIRGHDTRIAQMAAVMVGGFAMATGAILRSAGEQRRGDATPIPGFGFVAIPVLIFGGIGWFFSKITADALSRQREYLADAAAVEFTRNPTALIRALEHIARIESPLKASLRAVAPLFIVDPFECGSAGRDEFLDNVARVEADASKTKEQRDAEVADLMVKGMAQQNVIVPHTALSSHPPIHDRIARLCGLMHQPSAVQPPDQVDAERAAAAKLVADVVASNPDVAAAAIESMIRARPGEQLMHALGVELPAGASDPDPASEQDPVFADTSEQAQYQKLYEYNLGLTRDKPGPVPGSPQEMLLGGQPKTIDPAQLRAAITLGMARMQKRSVPPASAHIRHTSSAGFYYLFWLVMALSAGAIVAALAIG